jgi:SAM-dependent methyltransferase
MTRCPPIHHDTTGYGRLVRDGHYADAPSGLWGKYDNVRRIWEDQITRFAVRPALAQLVHEARLAGRGLRIIDLGCGTGEGHDLLLRVPPGQRSERGRYVLEPEDLAVFHGIDLCPEMVAQCRARFSDDPRMRFTQADLNDCATLLRREPPYDLYYNSYGSLSHLADDGLRNLIDAIVASQQGPCALVIDVHGQYSPEWPCHWSYSRDPQAPRMQPYNMVWMYPPAERERRLAEQHDYRVRYWRGDELRDLLRSIPGLDGRMHHLSLVDRSVLVGRHMDTACFDQHARPIRRAVNTLFEFNCAVDPATLAAYTLPGSGDPAVDRFFAEYTRSWNTLLHWFTGILQGEPVPTPAELCQAGGPVPMVLEGGMQVIADAARNLAWFDPGDPEANLLQPKFGLLLRQLEFHMQRGLGCGHGLVAVLTIAGVGQPSRP